MLFEFLDTEAAKLTVAGIGMLAICVGLYIWIEWSSRPPVRDGTGSTGNGGSSGSSSSSETTLSSAYAGAYVSASSSSATGSSDGGGAC